MIHASLTSSPVLPVRLSNKLKTELAVRSRLNSLQIENAEIDNLKDRPPVAPQGFSGESPTERGVGIVLTENLASCRFTD